MEIKNHKNNEIETKTPNVPKTKRRQNIIDSFNVAISRLTKNTDSIETIKNQLCKAQDIFQESLNTLNAMENKQVEYDKYLMSDEDAVLQNNSLEDAKRSAKRITALINSIEESLNKVK